MINTLWMFWLISAAILFYAYYVAGISKHWMHQKLLIHHLLNV